MSTTTYLTSLVQQVISRLNNYEANAKKVGELPHQTNLNTASKIPVDTAGISGYITVNQIASAIQNGNYNQLLAIGAVSVNELTNEITVASGVTAQINGSIYQTTTDTAIPITLCPAGFSRKDILVLTTSNTVIAISGEETDGAIVLAPPVPIDAIYITEFDVNDNAIGTPSDPILGAQFKQKIENTRWESTQSGTDVVIPFQAAGQMHYSVVNSGLISVAGFSTANLTGPLYEGIDVIFENQTGNPITLKNMFGGISTPVKFNFGADLIVPNGGKLWMRVRNREFELIMKSWSDVVSKKTHVVKIAGVFSSSETRWLKSNAYDSFLQPTNSTDVTAGFASDNNSISSHAIPFNHKIVGCFFNCINGVTGTTNLDVAVVSFEFPDNGNNGLVIRTNNTLLARKNITFGTSISPNFKFTGSELNTLYNGNEKALVKLYIKNLSAPTVVLTSLQYCLTLLVEEI